MVIIGLSGSMTNGATKYCEIARGGVAIGTLIPFVFMLAAVNGEIHCIVIKS